MAKSYRLKTSLNSQGLTDQTLRVKIDQDFDFLEILSLKLTQTDVYKRFCSDYGVIAGRVVANGGFGIPNAKVSVFIPIDDVDLNNPVISTLYPYQAPTDKNEDGYRYNLLPYEPSYEGHVPTGTFPSKNDVLTRKEVLEIYEKYYKYTVRTNESGDYMIVGVPLGDQKIVLDVDLSDMGCFSLRPTDLIRMNRGNRQQFDGNNFRSSEDLNSLPQIVNVVRAVNIGSFWGESDECNIGITRVDFDLRDQGINIEPTAVFMGSIFSSNDEDYLKNNCKPKAEQGDLCGLVTGPGTLLAVRQSVNLDQFGRPILEQYPLPSGGKVIDENGAFVLDLPMNLDYLITDEYGNLVVSQDPKVGIPSKAKYRFKVKYNSSVRDIATLSNPTQIINPNLLNLGALAPRGSVLRGNYLIPNIKEYGWVNDVDPVTKEGVKRTITLEFSSSQIEEIKTFVTPSNTAYRVDYISGATGVQFRVDNVLDNSKWLETKNGGTISITTIKKTNIENVGGVNVEVPEKVKLVLNEYDYDYVQFQKSYSFSLDWDDYPNYEDAVNCNDTFYEFKYNKVYTVSQLIDEYRKGTNRARFLSIKEVLQRNCQSETNKFPVNDGVRNFDLLYFIISTLFNILSITFTVLIPVYSLVKFLWNRFAVILAAFFIAYTVYRVASSAIVIAGYINAGGPVLGGILREAGELLLWGGLGAVITTFFKRITKLNLPPLRLPMLTYPDCSSCDCGEFDVSEGPGDNEFNTSPLADINIPSTFKPYQNDPDVVQNLINQGYGQVVAGRDDKDDDSDVSEARTPRYKLLDSEYWSSTEVNPLNSGTCGASGFNSLTIPERINLYNTKGHYFNTQPGGGSNRIKVYPNYTINKSTDAYYEDQPLVVIMDPNFLLNYSAGTILSFASAGSTKDSNITGTTQNKNGLGSYNVTGTTPNNDSISITVTYANPNNDNSSITKTFIVNNGYTGLTTYSYPADIEYYQVVTGYTLNDLDTVVQNNTKDNSFYDNSFYNRIIRGQMNIGWGFRDEDNDRYIDYSTCEGISYVMDRIPDDIRKELSVVVLMKGVDPYSTRQKTKVDVSRIFGLQEGSLMADSRYKLNIPIQSGLNLDNYSNYTTNQNTNLFYPSYYFTPSVQTTEKEWRYSSFTTNNHLLYSSFDTSNVGNSSTSNNIVNNSSDGYFNNEYIQGGSLMVRTTKKQTILPKRNGSGGVEREIGNYQFYRSVYNYTATTMSLTSNLNIVMRSDRLPRSDNFDNNFVLAQNKSFAIYVVPETGFVNIPIGSISNINDFSTDNSIDFEEAYGEETTSALSTFSCNKMVPIGAYKQNDNGTLELLPETDDVYWITDSRKNKRVVNGCYQFCAEDLTFGADLKNLAEWKSRFLLGFAICRNVFGLTFTNQWINGSLYMPGFQNDKIYSGPLNVSNPTYKYCKDKIVFRIENNSFFYRSSPYNSSIGFVGMPADTNESEKGNKYYLGNPTTVVDLGPKDNIIKNICTQPEFQGYVAGKLPATSYNSVSDLLQLFTMSRLSNSSWLGKLLGVGGNASVQGLFSRRGDKIDGDFAQLISINSEFGVVPFTPEGYSSQSTFFNVSKKPIVGVFFTGDTADRDYVSPGREIFIDTTTKVGVNNFGKKSQIVPMYQWSLDLSPQKDSKPLLFGSDQNDWFTDRESGKFYEIKYQGIDRLNGNTYFASPISKPTTQRPGYIYASKPSVDSNNNITGFTYDGFYNPSADSTFLVGAPNHFYFGLKIGKTALDKFIQDYAIEI